MPSKKKKYNARFPAGRIKKIMQTDKEVGKVAQAVPVIISRTLELFVESLLTKSIQITQTRNAKTLTPYHMKQCILSESRFDFLKDLVKYIPDVSSQEENESNLEESEFISVPEDEEGIKQEVNSNLEGQGTSAGRTPVIQYMPKSVKPESDQDQNLLSNVPVPTLVPSEQGESAAPKPVPVVEETKIPPLIPLANNNGQNSSDMLLIDEDYDN